MNETPNTLSRPLILVSNDDGYSTSGIRTLINIAKEFGEVVAVAPDSAQSGKSSSITLSTPLRATEREVGEGYRIVSVNGTPTDCVKLACNDLVPRKPDLVLGGINHGYNTGNCTIYSGTMGVVFEGCLLQIPSIGFSIGSHNLHEDLSHCVPYIRSVIKGVLQNGLPKGVCINVNFPTGEIKGLKVTKACQGFWFDEFDKRIDPFNRTYYWMVGQYKNLDEGDPMGDITQCEAGYGAVTPCRPDQTAYEAMPFVQKIIESI